MDGKKLVAVQNRVATHISNFLKNTKAKKSAAAQTVAYFEARLKLLHKYFDDFYARNEQLIEYESELAEDEYFTSNVFDLVEIAYIDAVAEISQDIENLRAPRSLAPTGQQSAASLAQPTREDDSVKVPRVTLPSFSGDRDEWESFKQRFTSLIINKRHYSEVDKLQYLLGCLQGKAASRLKDIEIIGENFRLAWDQLDKQFGGKRRRLSDLIEKLIQLKPIRARNAQDISELLDVVVVTVRALQKLGCELAALNHWLVHCILRKLDSHTKETFKISKESDLDFYQYTDLISFLENRLDSLDSEKDKPDSRSAGGTSNKSNGKAKSSSSSTSAHTADVQKSDSIPINKKLSKCLLCQDNHSISSCDQFNSMSAHQRFDFCKRSKLCLNCLGKSHLISECKSPHRCFVCKSKHHTKLHFESKTPASKDEAPPTEIVPPVESIPENSVTANFAAVSRSVLLATAKIVVSDSFKNSIIVRALIDPGAQRSFITERLVKQLIIKRKPTSVAILGVGGQATSKALGEAVVNIRSPICNSFNCPCTALILPELTRLLPSQKILQKTWPHLKGLQLADPQFATPGKIDMILGADMYDSILQEGLVKGTAPAPVAQSTVYGWVLTGTVDSQRFNSPVAAFHTVTDSTLSQILSKFWEIEEIPISHNLTPEDEYCENHFVTTFSRNAEGRFVVRLPFATKKPFVDSRDIAVACLLRSEKRRRNLSELQDVYAKFMQEYETLGHMQMVTPIFNNVESFYLPHHAVFRAESNKIRVVFNASQRCAAGYSLNELLHSGPKLQTDITRVILLWRFGKFAMMTDIVKMFRQILVHEDDCDWQRLVWRADLDTPIKDYRALTVTYGMTCAPFLSIRSIIQLARDGQASHPRASSLLRKCIYVDDIFLGEDNESEVRAQRDELVDLLASAGMSLGKWASNSPELLLSQQESEVVELPTSSGEIVSTLGLKWNTSSDVFLFKAALPPITSLVSKRTVLSDTARLFDPMGFIAPVLIKSKLLLQDMWINQLDWDAPLPQDLRAAWLSLRSEFADLSGIKIPRWIGTTRDSEWHLHGFSDASKRAYAAAVYAVIPGKSSHLLMAKTRVAPVKVETIPRLELCGATLLVRLTKHVINGLFQQPTTANFWTDSKVVLDWLQGHPSRWPTFIANRVSEIISTFPNATWRHVPTKDNPADCASRGSSTSELARSDIWWKGPNWLTGSTEEWPDQLLRRTEEAQNLVAVSLIETNDKHEFLQALERFSSFSQIVRVLAYCLRWNNQTNNSKPKKFAGLSVLELTRAKISLISLLQQTHFKTDINLISTGKAVPPSSMLARLSPFMDSDGLVRVGGRLHHASLPYSERHPIVLPGRCRIVRLLIEEAHRITYHGGVQLMKSFLQRNYWIIRGNRQISAVYRQCITCVRFGARPSSQQMAPLPAERLRPARPFSTAGLDFAGPFPLLFSKGRGAKSTKGYVAIFICLSIKAVHIEVVSDLTTDAFLAAFSRFSARRGLCSVLYSDNGTNFKGADTELQRLFRQSSEFSQHVYPQLAARGTEWKFIPPRAPHFGGLWEAAVRSFKYHLRRVVGSTTFTFEEFATLTAKIEACLNSRPLCPLSCEAHDPVALTPGHFLVGTSLMAHPEPIRDQPSAPSLNKRWQLLTHARDSFWLRWRKEVFSQMQQRAKWLKEQPNLQVGDLVILKDELTSPAAWPLAIVTMTHPGKDGLVRVVSLRTAKTNLVRPVVKLLRVPADEDADAAYAHFSTVKEKL